MSDQAHKPELLAPAGGREQLETAVRFGADAVYLAADRFGMRQRAENFSLDAIPDAVAFAHAAGVRVFVTLNTLMHADDIATLPPYLEALGAAGVDAFIVGDLGAFRLAQRHASQVALHVSTQASVANAEAARVWHELGARRVVCAREMSLEDIAQMRADAPRDLEIEVFVHGAMCMAVSGRCLLSSAMTGRSGNKGFCTQPCRWSYALVEEKRPGQYYPIEEDTRGSYVMNAQDLNMLEHVDDLVAAGVDSLKIEGRNKKAFYVATVVRAYRAVLDGADPAAFAPELLTISHRPYSTGFYYGGATQSPERDGYLKEYLLAATVLSCEPVSKKDTHCDTLSQKATCGNAAPEIAACENVTSAGTIACGDMPAAGNVDDTSDAPCCADDSWRVVVECRNRFCEGDTLDVVSPRSDVFSVQVHNLAWMPDARESGFVPDPVAVEVANRASNRYTFQVNHALREGDMLRILIPQAAPDIALNTQDAPSDQTSSDA